MSIDADKLMPLTLHPEYLEELQVHIDEGGTLSHQNGVDLLREVNRLRAARTEPAGAVEASASWAEAWHRCAENLMTMAGLSSSGSPEEMCAEFQRFLATPVPDGWRTIDSAPKDGRYILAGRFRDTELKWVKHSRWISAEEAAEAEDSVVPDDYLAGWTDGEDEYDYCVPTHWMPLPAAPAETRGR